MDDTTADWGAFPETSPDGNRAYVIVVGSEKGGTGKSTTTAHLAIALAKLGYRVGTLDLDARQGTLTSFLENRQAFATASGRALETPRHEAIRRADLGERQQAEAEERACFKQALTAMADRHFILVDTPGSDSHLSRLGHCSADTLITPLNDSYLDIAVLARIDRDKREVQAPSIYSKMVWAQNNNRIVTGRSPIDWIVLRNRLAHIDARNMRDIGRLLDVLAKRIGFRVAPGIGERVVFRELFLKGLTALDLPEAGDAALSPSHRAARQEIEQLLQTIGVLQTAAQASA